MYVIHTISKHIVGFIRVFLILNDPKPLNQFRGKPLDPGLVTLFLKCPESYQPYLNGPL
jgi:hypothetical protein